METGGAVPVGIPAAVRCLRGCLGPSLILVTLSRRGRPEDARMCYNARMNWLRWNPDLAGNVKALLLVAFILGAFAAVVIYYPVLPRLNPNAGFGPDWDC